MTAILCYGLFLALGARVSFEDWREQKIRNRLLIMGLLACGAGLLWALGNTILGHSHLRLLGLGVYYLPWRYYPSVLLHISLSLAAAVALWRLAIWPAGDAKFFVLLSLFVVLIDPNLPGFPRILFLLLLVNIFVPAGLFFVGETLLLLALRLPRLRRCDPISWLRARVDMLRVRLGECWPYRFDYLMLVVNLFALFLLFQSGMSRLSRLVGGPWAPLSVFLLMTAAWGKVAGVLRNRAAGILMLGGLSLWMLAGALLWSWDVSARVLSALKMTLNFGLFLSLGRGLFCRMMDRESLSELASCQLRSGTVLSDETWERIGYTEGLSETLEERCVDGISESDVGTLKGWLASQAGAGLKVYRTVPFALWIFFGALLTLSRRCNVLAILIPQFWRARKVLLSMASRGLS